MLSQPIYSIYLWKIERMRKIMMAALVFNDL